MWEDNGLVTHKKQVFKSKRFWIIVLSVLLSLVVTGGGVWLLFKNNERQNLNFLDSDTGFIVPVDDEKLNTNVNDTWTGNSAAFTHGTGTENDPYLVESAANLAYLSANYSSYNACYFRQTVNIDLNNKAWIPINFNGTTWDCCFDGNGKKISNLKITIGRASCRERVYSGV